MPQPAPTRRLLLGALAAPAFGRVATAAPLANGWPNRPVRIIVPYAAGGGTDTMARMAAEALAARFGQPFIVDNRGGAGGSIATDFVARAAPDGYTLLFCGNTQMGVLPHLQRVTYDPARDFRWVTIFGLSPAVFAVHPSIPATTLGEFVTYAKARPGELNYGSPGSGTIAQLATALWAQRAGVQMEHVPFRSAGQCIAEGIAGRVQMVTGVSADVLAGAADGRLRVLAVTGPARLARAPEIPTVSDSMPGFVFTSWNGFVVPTGTAPEIIEAIAQECAATVRRPAVASRLQDLGITPVGNTPTEMADFIAQEAPILEAAARTPGARHD